RRRGTALPRLGRVLAPADLPLPSVSASRGVSGAFPAGGGGPRARLRLGTHAVRLPHRVWLRDARTRRGGRVVTLLARAPLHAEAPERAPAGRRAAEPPAHGAQSRAGAS